MVNFLRPPDLEIADELLSKCEVGALSFTH